MPSIGVWIGDDDVEKIQKKLNTGETIGQFIKALVQKFLDPNVVVLNCSAEELFGIDAGRNDRSRDEYLRKLIREARDKNTFRVNLADTEIEKIRNRAQGDSVDFYLARLIQNDLALPESPSRDQGENLPTEGEEESTKSDFRALLGEEIFAKIQPEAGESCKEFLQKLILRQTDENTIFITCPKEEISQIDTARNGKSRSQYLHELLAKEHGKALLPPAEEGIKEQIKEGQENLKTEMTRLQAMLSAILERLPNPYNWRIDGIRQRASVFPTAILPFLG